MEEKIGQDQAMALMVLMDMVGTSAKLGEALGERFLRAGAIEVMPDGVVVYNQAKFSKVLKELVMEIW